MGSYRKFGYEELPEPLRRKALRQVKKVYREILADEGKLIDLIRQQRTEFGDDGTLSNLIGLPMSFVTGEDLGPSGRHS